MLKHEAVIRLDLPEKPKVHKKVEYNWRDWWKSVPEIVMAGGAVFLLLFKAIAVIVSVGVIFIGIFAILGNLRHVGKHNS